MHQMIIIIVGKCLLVIFLRKRKISIYSARIIDLTLGKECFSCILLLLVYKTNISLNTRARGPCSEEAEGLPASGAKTLSTQLRKRAYFTHGSHKLLAWTTQHNGYKRNIMERFRINYVHVRQTADDHVTLLSPSLFSVSQ